MAKMLGKRGRSLIKGARRKIAGSKSTSSKPSVPSWKPAKPAEGNYGKLVSAAAHTRNAARKATGSTPAMPAMKDITASKPSRPATAPPVPRRGKPSIKPTEIQPARGPVGLPVSARAKQLVSGARRKTRGSSSY